VEVNEKSIAHGLLVSTSVGCHGTVQNFVWPGRLLRFLWCKNSARSFLLVKIYNTAKSERK